MRKTNDGKKANHRKQLVCNNVILLFGENTHTGNGKSEKHRWTAAIDSYIEKDNIKIPSKMKAIWNLPGEDYEYFNGTLTDIVYNCKKAD